MGYPREVLKLARVEEPFSFAGSGWQERAPSQRMVGRGRRRPGEEAAAVEREEASTFGSLAPPSAGVSQLAVVMAAALVLLQGFIRALEGAEAEDGCCTRRKTSSPARSPSKQGLQVERVSSPGGQCRVLVPSR